jgi:hypothetical protein
MPMGNAIVYHKRRYHLKSFKIINSKWISKWNLYTRNRKNGAAMYVKNAIPI